MVLSIRFLLSILLTVSVSHASDITYVTDIEGSITRLHSFFAQNPLFSKGEDQKYHLKEGAYFVFGGDAPDRFFGGKQVLEELARLKEESPDHVFFILGNRDINKMRLPVELGPKTIGVTPYWFFFAPQEALNTLAHNKIERLKFILNVTMKAPQSFELRRQEIGSEASDEAVYESFLNELKAGGAFYKILEAGSIATRIHNTLFVHGGLTLDNFGFIPGHTDRYENVAEWIAKINQWYQERFQVWAEHKDGWTGTGPRPAEDLLNYPIPISSLSQQTKQRSIIYGRNVDQNNNPHLPPREIINMLLAQGISRVVVGHTPTGDAPTILRTSDGRFEMVSADNSYAPREENASIVLFTNNGLTADIEGQVELGGTTIATKSVTTIGARTPIGRKTLSGSLVIANAKENPKHYIATYMKKDFVVVNEIITQTDMNALYLIEATPPLFVNPYEPLENNFKKVFDSFLLELKRRITRVSFHEKIEHPPFRADVSSASWVEFFIDHILDLHSWDEDSNLYFTGTAKFIFSKFVAPQHDCMRSLKGIK